MGRWQGIRREEWLCKQCDSGVVEDVYHWMVECNAFGSAREPLLELMEDLDDGFNQKTKEQKTTSILTNACSHYQLLSCVSALWMARFYS